MLVLSRKPGESIIVDGPCRVTVLKSVCKLGIESGAKVLREELARKPLDPEKEPTVYVVDDDADLLNAYKRYFTHYGLNVKLFQRADEFLDYVQEERDGAVAVIDLRLADEDLDGLQVLQQLRAWHHDYPVILLTGYGDVDTCRRAFHSGCYTFLQKPLPPADLFATVQDAVQLGAIRGFGSRPTFNPTEE